MTKLLGAREVAFQLGISLRKLEQMIDCGELPAHVKFGRIRKWRDDEIQQWLDTIFSKEKPTDE